MAESKHELTRSELGVLLDHIVASSDGPEGRYELIAAPGRAHSSSTVRGRSTHRQSIAQLQFADADPITLTVMPDPTASKATYLVRSSADGGPGAFLLSLGFILAGVASGLFAAVTLIIYLVRMLNGKAAAT